MNESNDVTMRGENVPEAMVASAVVAQPVAPGGSTAAITGAPVTPPRRRGSKLARFFVILGIVLLSSVFVLPLLAEAMDSGSNPSGVASGWTFFFAVFYVAPFGLISFLLAIFAKLAQKLDEKEQGL
ncbi:hypothetical protein FBF35_00385 [Schaalia odontolytica]|mgnify:FL=1|uniref:Uncharacterized protein n=1 Tax=Schaalia odontolytica TaxID=1660 RepID=A0A0V8RZ94_9ACTO|nr:hypothetical protein [Schaalia odontolytica]KSW13336.1 hypothetical protein APY09_03005 [Schaalia odontolytica]QCT34620.1 hypothetical protein FBF35_00385 [Schaalia odontolytica]